MRKTVLATAVAAALTLAAASASAQTKGTATKADLQAMQAQMEALAQRLNKLEAANAQLQSENAELKAVVDRRDAETDYLKAQTKDLRADSAAANAEIDKVKGADWATRIKWRGDFRYRHENVDTQRVVGNDATATVEDAATRDRQRIRARFGFDAKVTDHVNATMLLATGGDDPRSSNQTLGSFDTRKSIGLDMAYIDWNALQGVDVLLGKQPWPFWRPGQSLFFDGDFNPEGGAVKFDRGMLFGSAYGWWLTENYNANPKGKNADTNVVGAQLGVKFPLFGGETRLAAHYFDCGACKDQSPLYANSGNGNTTYAVNGVNFLKYDYQIMEFSAGSSLTAFNLPLQLWIDYAQNLASGVKYDTAYSVGASLGNASNAHTWAAAVWYQSIDKDALFGQFVDSDFADGKTDGEGWVLRGAYAPVKNFNVMATYYINQLNKDVAPVSGTGFKVGDSLDYNRLQLDLNYKF